MSDKPANLLRRLSIWLLVLAAVAGAIYLWGDDVLYYATGQDILDELNADLAALPDFTPTLPPQDYPPVEESPAEPPPPAEAGFPAEPRFHVFRYVVQPGDALTLIAERFGLHPDTIFWANTETLHDNVDSLQVGMELYILPENGVYHRSDGRQTIAEIAAQYGVTAADILVSPYNLLAGADGSYIPPAGLRLVVPGGRRDFSTYPAPVQTEASGEAAEETQHPGACPPAAAPPEPANDFINPMVTQPYRVIAEFAPWHPGVDMATSEGAYAHAAEAGVVVFAGWHRDGYGNLVIIDHGGGWTTYYAHLDEVGVYCGQRVSKAQPIGVVGMTGHANTTHLHFEMRLNDVPQDPRPGACRQRYTYNGNPTVFDNPLGTTPYLVTAEFDSLHAGVDLAASRGTPVYTVAPGVVIYAGWSLMGYGELVVIDHGNSWTSYYGHLDNRFVNCGDVVQRGTPLGEMGMSGNATGVHLHFELHLEDAPVNPRLYFEVRDRRDR